MTDERIDQLQAAEKPAENKTGKGRRWRWGRTLPFAALPATLGIAVAVSATEGPGCVGIPAHGSSVRFPAPDPSVNVSFVGEANDNAVKVEVYSNLFVNGVPFPIGQALLGETTPVLVDGKKKFDFVVSVLRNGAVPWGHDDVISFSVREQLSNGTWQWMPTGEPGNFPPTMEAPHDGKAIIGVADRPDQAEITLDGTAWTADFPNNPFQTISGAGQQRAHFLGAEGIGNPGDGDAYYAAIGAGANLDTLGEWKALFGFPTGEVVTYYRNDQDLGWGREMHCRLIEAHPTQPWANKAACYVTNYVNENLAAGANPADVLATVAMDFDVTRADKVRFYVYGKQSDPNCPPGNPNECLLPKAALDGSPGGAKEVPRLCMNCHGGFLENGKVTEAHFLPFDLAYLPVPASKGAQKNEFKSQNFLVYAVEANNTGGAAIVDLATGWYGGVGGFFDASEYNAGWFPNAWADNPRLYNTMIAPYCRTCHIAQSDTPDIMWTTPTQVFNKQTNIRNFVCNKTNKNKVMPHAQRTYQKFWSSGARAAIALEMGALSCVYNHQLPP